MRRNLRYLIEDIQKQTFPITVGVREYKGSDPKELALQASGVSVYSLYRDEKLTTVVLYEFSGRYDLRHELTEEKDSLVSTIVKIISRK